MPQTGQGLQPHSGSEAGLSQIQTVGVLPGTRDANKTTRQRSESGGAALLPLSEQKTPNMSVIGATQRGENSANLPMVGVLPSRMTTCKFPNERSLVEQKQGSARFPLIFPGSRHIPVQCAISLIVFMNTDDHAPPPPRDTLMIMPPPLPVTQWQNVTPS